MRGRLLPFTYKDIANDVDLAFFNSMDSDEGSYRMKSGERVDPDWEFSGLKGRCYVARFQQGKKEILPGTRRYNELFRELYLDYIAWKLSRV